MDRNDYYGGDSASLNLTQVRFKLLMARVAIVYSDSMRVALQKVQARPDSPCRTRSGQGLRD